LLHWEQRVRRDAQPLPTGEPLAQRRYGHMGPHKPPAPAVGAPGRGRPDGPHKQAARQVLASLEQTRDAASTLVAMMDHVDAPPSECPDKAL
jgi:hypothetical protein